jgi:hypothetical protein
VTEPVRRPKKVFMALPAMPRKRLRHNTRGLKGDGLRDRVGRCWSAGLSRSGERSGDCSEFAGMLCEASSPGGCESVESLRDMFGNGVCCVSVTARRENWLILMSRWLCTRQTEAKDKSKFAYCS